MMTSKAEKIITISVSIKNFVSSKFIYKILKSSKNKFFITFIVIDCKNLKK